MLLSALQHIFAGLKRTRDQKLSSGLKSGQLNLASLFHRRGACAVECVAAHLRGFEEDSRSEVVFWSVAHVHVHSHLPIPPLSIQRVEEIFTSKVGSTDHFD